MVGEIILIFLVGLCLGSFLNVLIYRILKKKDFLFTPSFCPHCKRELKIKDLIPLFSYIFLKGKCRYCQKKISIRYPLLELFSALFLTFLFLKSKTNILFFLYLVIIFVFLLSIFLYDLFYYLIPDFLIFFLIFFTFIFQIYFSKYSTLYPLEKISLKNSSLSAIGTSFFFFLIYFLSKGKWLGFGDVKLAFFLGLFLGFPKILLAIFLASLIGSFVGLVLIALKKKKFNSKIPFAPYLITGTVFSFIFGKEMIALYLKFL